MSNYLTRYCIILILTLFTCASKAESLKQQKALRFGVLPALSMQKLFYRYKPLRNYLQKVLHKPVILLTAVNYSVYVKRASEYKYDLYYTAPHMAALAERDYGYRRVCMFTRDLRGYLVVRKQGNIKTIADLKGHIVAAPERLAILTMMGESLLERHHLIPGHNVNVDYNSTHNSAILELVAGKAQAAIVSSGIYDRIKPSIHDKLLVLDKTRNISHLMFMASPKLPEKEYLRLKNAMLKFTADGPGKVFFSRSPYGDMAPIRDVDMRNMQPYIARLKQRLPWLK